MIYHAAGWLEGGLTASFEKFVIDCEVLQQIIYTQQSIKIDDEEVTGTGMGVGPVNALDNALRNNFKSSRYAELIRDLSLIDYKVRILNTGTDAVTRVSIESSDEKKKSWYTVGVSENIIEASFKALIDSVEFKLMREKANV